MPFETAKEKLLRKKQEEINNAQHLIKIRLLDHIGDKIIIIFYVILEIAIVIAIIVLIFWFNLTDGIATIADKSRWEGYKEFLRYINSHVIVSLLTIIFMKNKPQKQTINLYLQFLCKGFI